MYYLFQEKNVLPHDYYNFKEGEKMVIRAFFEFDMEQRIKKEEEFEKERRLQKLKRK